MTLDPADFTSYAYRLGWLEWAVGWSVREDRPRDDAELLAELRVLWADYQDRCQQAAADASPRATGDASPTKH
jgi:hypothetical protein